MKPTKPTSDSLVSEMIPQNQVPQPPNVNSTTPSANTSVQPAPDFEQSIQPSSFSSAPTEPQTSPFLSANPNSVQENAMPPQTAQPSETTPVNPIFSNPPPMQAQVGQFMQATPPTAQEAINNPVQPTPQTTSPFDTPPAPAQQPQPVQSAVNPGNAIVDEKPKKKAPVFLVLLLFLVVIVLGAVGFLAYQNYKLNKAATENAAVQPSLKTPATTNTDPYSGYTSHKSKILSVEFMIPSDWKTEETEEPDLGNQKMIRSTSPDFLYEGDAIASGYEFRVGPVSDLTKKYDSFEAFSAEENVDNTYTLRTINGIKWLVKASEAKTLLETSPLVITLYTGASQATGATETFTKILNSFRIGSSVSVTPGVTQSILPTSAPLQ